MASKVTTIFFFCIWEVVKWTMNSRHSFFHESTNYLCRIFYQSLRLFLERWRTTYSHLLSNILVVKDIIDVLNVLILVRITIIQIQWMWFIQPCGDVADLGPLGEWSLGPSTYVLRAVWHRVTMPFWLMKWSGGHSKSYHLRGSQGPWSLMNFISLHSLWIWINKVIPAGLRYDRALSLGGHVQFYYLSVALHLLKTLVLVFSDAVLIVKSLENVVQYIICPHNIWWFWYYL